MASSSAALNRSKSKFNARNLIYLRISKHSVLMMNILIDPIHLKWFNEPEDPSSSILTKLIEILKPRISLKLESEKNLNNKKSKLDIYRGSGFQFGYYFRQNTPHHTILLKSRESIHPIKFEPLSDKEEQDELNTIKPDPDEEPPSSSLKVHYQPFSIFDKSLIVVIEPFPLPNHYTQNPDPINSTSQSASTLNINPTRPLFNPSDDDDEGDDDEELPELDAPRSVLSNLIKHPNSDRQLDRRSQAQSTLDSFISHDHRTN